jgi:hypothetical protein
MSLVYDFSSSQAHADARWPQMPHSTGHEQSAAFATILFELRNDQGHPYEMFLKPSGQNWQGWDGQYYSEDTAVLRLPDGSVWQKDCIVACGDPSAYISFGRAEDWQPPNPPSDADKCVPPPTPPDAPDPTPPNPEPPVVADYLGDRYLGTAFHDYLTVKRDGTLKTGSRRKFTLEERGAGKVSLKVDGSYVCADPNIPDQSLMANRSDVGPWETFLVTVRDDGKIALQAESSGLFVCADDRGLVTANRDTAGDEEAFTVEPA